MDREEYNRFALKSESLVRPKDIIPISFLGDFNKYLPKSVQQKMVEAGTKKAPYMGFIVDPYCFFMTYPIKDMEKAKEALPEGYELAETSLFKDEVKRPLMVVGVFSIRTSAFMGKRLECYLIAKRKDTGRMAWIITDYETDTSSHDPKNGFCGFSADSAVHTATPYGELLLRMENTRSGKSFSAHVDLESGKTETLDEKLWVEGNFCVDYGGFIKDPGSLPFSLIFDPYLMREAKRIPLEKVSVEKNTFMADIIDVSNPLSAAVFPYSQHFVIRQDMAGENLSSEKDVRVQIGMFLGNDTFKQMLGDDLKKPLFRGMMISSIVNFCVILLLLILLLKR